MSLLLLLKDKPKADFHTDDFSGTLPENETPPWFNAPVANNTEAESGGTLTVTLSGTASQYSRWKSIDTWDLKDSQAHMEVDGSGLQSAWLNTATDHFSAECMACQFRLGNDDGAEQATIRILGKSTGPVVEWNRRENASSNLGTEAYNATNHRWLRVREASGTIYFERSATGAPGSWTTMNGGGSGEAHTWTDAELGTCSFTFYIGSGNTGEGTGSSVSFDNLNIAGVAATGFAFRRIVNVSG